MCAGSKIIRDRQKAIRREMTRRSILLKQVFFDSGIPLQTLATYFPEDPNKQPAQIPGGAIYSLVSGEALPPDLLDLLMPEGVIILRTTGELDHNEVALRVTEYQTTLAKARHPDSPAKEKISDCEQEDLDAKVARIGGGA